MQFSSDEWLAFARKLEQATSQGKIQWTGSENPFADDHGFSATVRGSATYTIRSRDSDGEFPYVLTISDPGGPEIAEFATVSFGDAYGHNPEQEASETLVRLYEEISRLVTGAPQKAKSLLDGLDGLITDVSDPF